MKYVFGRLVSVVVLLIAMSAITFTLTKLVPGDPAVLVAGQNAQREEIERIHVEMGLDDPIPVQYARYLERLVHFDLGESFQSGRPVMDDLGRFVPSTLELVIVAMLVIFVLGVALGTLSAYVAGSVYDRSSSVIASATAGAPVFWVALVAQLVFFYWLGWFPSGGELPVESAPPPERTGFVIVDAFLSGQWSTVGTAAKHLFLPVLALVIVNLGIIVRVTRQSVLAEMSKPYALVARSKGLPRWQVTLRHLIPNALNPVISLIGIQFGYAIVGAVLVESIYSWPGMGNYAFNAITSLDYPAIMGVTLFVAFAFTIVNLIVDLVQAWLDPRVGLR
jgi:peptide/nickel transport system permease protein